MTKRFLVAVIVILAGFGSVMTYVSWRQGILLDSILRCAAPRSGMVA